MRAAALARGVAPVGAVTTDVSEEFLSYLAEDAEGNDVVGTIGDPGETTLSPLRFVGGPVRAYRPQSSIGTVLADIGLDLVELPGGRVPGSPSPARSSSPRPTGTSSYSRPTDRPTGRERPPSSPVR